MFRTLRDVGTLLRYASVLAAHDALIPREYASRVPAPLRVAERMLRGGRAADAGQAPGQRLAKALEELGPSAIKLGQFLATRPDLVGSDMARGLETLQDKIPPFPDEEARRVVETEFGKPLEKIFSRFGPPVAAASIAQVHEAETTSEMEGEAPRRVAVKVLRPNVETQFARDFEAFGFAARVAERFSTEARRLRLRAVVDTLAASVALELDLRMEAAAASELAENMNADLEFRVPALDWPRTGARVLTTEWIDGTPLRNAIVLADAGHDPKKVAVSLLQIFLNQALRDGFFHADLHPGNLFVDKDGRLCAVDFGIMGRLSLTMRRFMAETLGGFLARDYMRVAQAHFAVGFVPKRHNVETFAQALRSIGEPVVGLKARDVSMARLLEQLFETTRRFDMQLQPELVLLQKTMVVVEGVARSLDPEFDIWESSRPVIESWMIDHLGPEARLKDAVQGFTALARHAQNLPDILRNTEMITAMMADGGLRLHPESVTAIAAAQAAHTRNGRVALWVAVGALGLIAISPLL